MALTTKQIVDEINTLLMLLPNDVYVNIVDESGNAQNLVLANLEEDNGQITAWCQHNGN